jgi:hypothetical protein
VAEAAALQRLAARIASAISALQRLVEPRVCGRCGNRPLPRPPFPSRSCSLLRAEAREPSSGMYLLQMPRRGNTGALPGSFGSKGRPGPVAPAWVRLNNRWRPDSHF